MPGRYWQLVAFTVATQLAAGMVVMLTIVLHMGARGVSWRHV
jgi:DMSO reductase anchor subunit